MGFKNPIDITCSDLAATEALARRITDALPSLATLLLAGPIGAGKTAFARALIQHRLAADGRSEEVPSPSFALIQRYETVAGDIVHADLYRLSHEDQVVETGLIDEFAHALVLVEWPDRLGPNAPADALTITISPDVQGEARLFRIGVPTTASFAQLRESLKP